MSVTAERARPGSSVPLPLTSSVGAKVIVAITGAGLLGFVLIHMVGNLQIFLGQETLNNYAHFLKSVPEILWVFRLGLLTFFVLHVWLALQLRLRSRELRDTPYVYERKLVTTRSATYMLVSGLMVLAFIVYHLMHFTFGWTTQVRIIDPATHAAAMGSVFQLRDARGYQDVYSMVIQSFQQPLISLTYIAAQLLLAFHLYHGASSLFQTLGINNRRINTALSYVGPLVATVIAVGNISIPVAVWTGILQLPVGG